MKVYRYVLFMLALLVSASMWGQYNPSNPPEPSSPDQGATRYTLTLATTPASSGYCNISSGTTYEKGATVSLSASAYTNFKFVAWEQDGEVVASTRYYTFTMPDHDVRLVARFAYDPSNPGEPSEPVITEYSTLYLAVTPAGGYINLGSGNRYVVGTTVSLTAYCYTDYTFDYWEENGEKISTSSSLQYVVKAGNPHLVAHFTYHYNPDNPGEPSSMKPERKLTLLTDPAGAGYFNISSGNAYQIGTRINLTVTPYSYYTFENWTIGDSVIATTRSLSYVIPEKDVTLTAHFSYHYVYDPNNPSEPGRPTGKVNIYGMTENGQRGQTIVYPVYLENPTEVKGMVVDVQFPERFYVKADSVSLAGRAAGHAMTVTPLADNNYRFSLLGNEPFTGDNGKVFEVPVTIADSAAMDSGYVVRLTHGVIHTGDSTVTTVTVRNGHIYVEPTKEEGLYAKFAYDKLLGRVKFTNLSSDNAVSWLWDFGDGTTSTERDPLHVYAEPGQYTVTLTARGRVGTDYAEQTILINDKSGWRLDGTLYLSGEESGVRHFTSAEELFRFVSGQPLSGALKVLVKADRLFTLPLTAATDSVLRTVVSRLEASGDSLTLLKDGDGSMPVLAFGDSTAVNDTSFVSVFTSLGRRMPCHEVIMTLWGVTFYPCNIRLVQNQTIRSGSQTTQVDLSAIGPGMNFTWALDNLPDSVTGYQPSGQGNIPAMTLINEGCDDVMLVYHITGTAKGITFCRLADTITVRYALVGSFTTLSPAKGALEDTTTVTLSWNAIKNAVYDVYLWRTGERRPSMPVVRGTTALSYTSTDYCAHGKSYQWQVVARSRYETMASDTMLFTVTKAHLTSSLYSITLPSADITYDGQAHGATASWTDGMGGIIITYATKDTIFSESPRQPGAYTVYVEIKEGDTYEGMANHAVGQFTIYALSDSEWQQVLALQQDLRQRGFDKWNTTAGVESVSTLEGLTLEQGHVVGISLPWRGLRGTFPASLLAFPQQRWLDITGSADTTDMDANYLSGDLTTILQQYQKEKGLVWSPVMDSLSIDGNALSGNIGALPTLFPSLTFLHAQNNRFGEMTPVIPETVDLWMSNQTLDWMPEIHLSHFDREHPDLAIPSLLFYDESSRQLTDHFACDISLTPYDPVLAASYAGGRFDITPYGSNFIYKGTSGDTLYAEVPGEDGLRCTFRLRLFFDPGDADFSGTTDASDLQLTLLYIRDIFGTSAFTNDFFNFTAANTYPDEQINIQDVVCTTNLLLADDNTGTQDDGAAKSARSAASDEAGEARLFVRNGQVVLYAPRPVAALSIHAQGDVTWTMQRLGMTQSIRGGNVVAYSLGGATLQAGETVIGTCRGELTFTGASLSDADARAISVSMEGTTTGITTLSDTPDADAEYYDLNGIRHNRMQRGLNIIKKGGRAIKIIHQ